MKRKFSGKIFGNVATKPTKREAEIRANGWREMGFLARIVKVKGGYDIYVRKKKK